MTLVNYNRSLLTNLRNGVSIPVTATPQKIMEFGLFVNSSVNFVELLTTLGWKAENKKSDGNENENDNGNHNLGTLLIEVRLDGTTIGSTTQEAVSDDKEDTIEMSTTFQKVLTNAPTGHRVFQVFVSNADPAQGNITIIGPASISGKVIVNTSS